MGGFMQGFSEGVIEEGLPRLFEQQKRDQAEQVRQDKAAEDKRRWELGYGLQKQAAANNEKTFQQEMEVNKVKLENAKMEQKKLQLDETHRQSVETLRKSGNNKEVWGRIQSLDTMNGDSSKWKYVGEDMDGRIFYDITDQHTGKTERIQYDTQAALDEAILKFSDYNLWQEQQKLRLKFQREVEKRALADRDAKKKADYASGLRRQEQRLKHKDALDLAEKKGEIASSKKTKRTQKRAEIAGNFYGFDLTKEELAVARERLDEINSMKRNDEEDSTLKEVITDMFGKKSTPPPKPTSDGLMSAHGRTPTSNMKTGGQIGPGNVKQELKKRPDGAIIWQNGRRFIMKNGEPVSYPVS